MNKRDDAAIYVMGYDKPPYDLMNNSLYTPIQCGAFDAKCRWLDIGDDSGDNISSMNHFYAETTGTYWVWKNAIKNEKYIGQCQYRRWLVFDENVNFDDIFATYDVILPVPYRFNRTIRKHYSKCHNIRDLELIEDIIKTKYSFYYDCFKDILDGDILWYSAGFVMLKNKFIEYCNFLFGVLGEYLNRLNANTVDDIRLHVENAMKADLYHDCNKPDINYQMLIGGFMAERLLSAFVISNFKNPYLLNYYLR